MILSDKNDQKQLGRSAQLEDVKYEEDDKRGRMVSMFYMEQTSLRYYPERLQQDTM